MLASLILTLAAVDLPPTDMAGQFKAGKLLCTNPDTTAKTCSTIDRVVTAADGKLYITGEVLISPEQSITLEIRSLARVEGSAVCGAVDPVNFQSGIVRANGVPLPADRNAAVLERLRKVFEPLFGKMACEGIRLDDGKLMKFGQVDGIDVPLPGKPVRWVGADEGYRVGSAPR